MVQRAFAVAQAVGDLTASVTLAFQLGLPLAVASGVSDGILVHVYIAVCCVASLDGPLCVGLAKLTLTQSLCRRAVLELALVLHWGRALAAIRTATVCLGCHTLSCSRFTVGSLVMSTSTTWPSNAHAIVTNTLDSSEEIEVAHEIFAARHAVRVTRLGRPDGYVRMDEVLELRQKPKELIMRLASLTRYIEWFVRQHETEAFRPARAMINIGLVALWSLWWGAGAGTSTAATAAASIAYEAYLAKHPDHTPTRTEVETLEYAWLELCAHLSAMSRPLRADIIKDVRYVLDLAKFVTGLSRHRPDPPSAS